MADKKISEFPLIASPTANDLMLLSSDGSTYSIKISTIKALTNSELATKVDGGYVSDGTVYLTCGNTVLFTLGAGEMVSGIIAPRFEDLSGTIDRGAHCIYNNKYYTCLSATTADDFDNAKWRNVTVATELESLFNFVTFYGTNNSRAELQGVLNISRASNSVQIGGEWNSLLQNRLFVSLESIFGNSVKFNKDVAVTADTLLKVVLLENFIPETSLTTSNNYTSQSKVLTASDIGAGWTPIAIAGYRGSSRYVQVSRLYLDVATATVNALIYNNDNSTHAMALDVYVLCLRTSL